jgi:DNA-binding MarR family transcriptional regulator
VSADARPFELSELVIATFRLNGAFLGAAEGLAKPAGLTAAWWQVLGAVLHEPLTVAGIAREMGITRQSVQRIADLLAERGLAAYEPNPAHARAKLLRATDAGLAAVRSIQAHYDPWAAAVTAGIDEARLHDALAVMRELAAGVERAGGG